MTDKDIIDLRTAIAAVEYHNRYGGASKTKYLPSVADLRQRWGITAPFYSTAEYQLKRLYRDQRSNAA